MKKPLNLTFVLLILFTFTTAYIADAFAVSTFVGPLIMVLAAFKFLLVAFQFMELKKAHLFWKTSIILTLVLLLVLIVGLK
ncbi:cytochrome C oxidase subunit IV family protein [Flavobacterium taihuense]|uniref:Cytochrome C oxidase subunit IV family protein n=1 Tax=Flavobacterium taihuense TaxID=2857508 RepID=A0ABS6XT80_9FLAO|nr:cytochrome C oxidase subunit IV family protein [Flavobacterium taihuense]MBW4359875.1 cytochrome C oxidase subunit IV family protein [Flavobacterium taihuense]